jgi:hypothetical protein
MFQMLLILVQKNYFEEGLELFYFQLAILVQRENSGKEQ